MPKSFEVSCPILSKWTKERESDEKCSRHFLVNVWLYTFDLQSLQMLVLSSYGQGYKAIIFLSGNHSFTHTTNISFTTIHSQTDDTFVINKSDILQY